MNIQIQFVNTDELSKNQLAQIAQLNEEAFSDVPEQEIRENFIAKSFARLIAYDGSRAIGTLQLFKRQQEFSGRNFLLGGMGGVCVTKEYRRKGIGSTLVKRALAILEEEGCEIVCLNVDLKGTAYQLYEKSGFELMERKISFENSKGEIIHDTGTMFKPLNSNEIFELIMSSNKTFHYGVGYW